MNRTSLFLIACAGLTGGAQAQPCSPQWSTDFQAGDPVGCIQAQAIYDPGTGERLYLGSPDALWEWNGTSWASHTIGPVFRDGVLALATWNPAGGPALVAAGEFQTIGGQAAANIASWDGTAWSPLAGGLGVSASGDPVRALCVYDEGAGLRLFACGGFTSAGGQPAARIARWDGATWSAVGSGLSGTGHAMAEYEGMLYITGSFQQAGGQAASNIARWNGTAWSALGTPFNQGLNGAGRAVTIHDFGAGPVLAVGGEFTTAGGLAARALVRWNGTAWSALPAQLSSGSKVFALLSDPVPGGPLIAAGHFTQASGRGIAAFNGAQWVGLGSGLPSPLSSTNEVVSLAKFDDGRGPAVFAGGEFTIVGGVGVRNVARWTGQWDPVQRERRGAIVSSGVLRVIDGPTGYALYACGVDCIGALPCESLARWDGSQWTAFPPAPFPGADARALAEFDDGGGAAIHVSWSTGGTARLTRWDGSAWQALPGVFTAAGVATVLHMASYDDGTGPALYVGGAFSAIDGAPFSSLARWRGGAWDSVGGGVSGSFQGESPSVHGLAVTPGGVLVAGNYSIAGGVPSTNVALWDGAWHSVAGAEDAPVLELTPTRSVLGPPVIVAGSNRHPYYVRRTGPGGVSPIWDLSPVTTRTMAAFDDGTGEALVVSGDGTAASARLYAGRGAGWGPLAGGVDIPAHSMAVFDDDGPGGDPPALWLLGRFTTVGGSVSSENIARLSACAGCYPDCNADGALNLGDFGCFQTKFALGEPYADCNGDGVLNLGDFGCFQTKFALGCP